ncbi:MAG: hypothetical protein ABIC40_08845 [bacterium]
MKPIFRTLISILFFSLVLSGMVGCTAGKTASPTAPTTNPASREAACPPVNPCVTNFGVCYDITLKRNGNKIFEYPLNGTVVIEDKDCNAASSSVIVKFKFMGPSGITSYPIPGIKTTGAPGKIYAGNQSKMVVENPFHTYKVVDTFELTVFDSGGQLKIEGTYHQHYTHWYSTGRGSPVSASTDWYCDVEGTAL